MMRVKTVLRQLLRKTRRRVSQATVLIEDALDRLRTQETPERLFLSRRMRRASAVTLYKALRKDIIQNDYVSFYVFCALLDDGRLVATESRAVARLLCDLLIAFRNGLYQRALDLLSRLRDARGLPPSLPLSVKNELRSIEATSLTGLGRHEEALAALETPPDAHPHEEFEASRNRAIILAWIRRPDEASAELDRMTEQHGKLRPKDRIFRLSVLGDRQPGDPLAEIEEALREPDCPKDAFLIAYNTAQDLGDGLRSRDYLARYFAAHELQPPRLPTPDEPLTLRRIIPEDRSPGQDGRPVTVVMTAFEAEETIEYAVRSVLGQSHANIELFVVEDHGGDETLAILRRLAAEDSRLVVVSNAENMGTYRSKNSALRVASGDFVTFHDSDDWWHPQHVAEHVRFMEAHPEVMVSTSRWARVDAGGRFTTTRFRNVGHPNPASTFLRREALDALGGFDSYRTGADMELLFRARLRFGAAAVRALAKPLALGLHRPDSLTQSGPAGYDENRYSPVREEYRARWLAWQQERVGRPGDLYVPPDRVESLFL